MKNASLLFAVDQTNLSLHCSLWTSFTLFPFSLTSKYSSVPLKTTIFRGDNPTSVTYKQFSVQNEKLEARWKNVFRLMIATKRANVGSSCYGRQLIFKRPWVRIQVLCNGWIWYLFTLICCKNCIVCLKRPKISKKRPGFAYLHYCSFTSFTYLPTFLFAQMFSAVVMLWILFCQMLFPIENILSWKKYCSLLLKYIQSCYVIQCEYNIERITKLASGSEKEWLLPTLEAIVRIQSSVIFYCIVHTKINKKCQNLSNLSSDWQRKH